MKQAFIFITSLVILGSTAATALADNKDVEDALKRRPDLSSFYEALVNTGVSHELRPDANYTVFAPTNAAFARLTPKQYPCLYSPDCRTEIAEIVRNHIFRGDVYIDDAARERGGLYSISGRFVNIGEPSRNDYSVDGNNIVYMSWYGDGILYKIDGVIANPRELAGLQYPNEYAEVPPEKVTTTTESQPDCNLPGCPKSIHRTTTVTHTAIVPYSAAPAR